MSFQINTADEISKLLSFLRVRSTANYEIRPELVEACFKALREFAKENNIRISIVTPSDERVVLFSSGGMLAGAAIGYLLGAVPGAIVGAVSGGLAGFALAHVTICIHLPIEGSGLSPILQIA
jgi:hypothetical protein